MRAQIETQPPCGCAQARETEWHGPLREVGIGMRAGAMTCVGGVVSRQRRRGRPNPSLTVL
jgi:hypothetical protein